MSNDALKAALVQISQLKPDKMKKGRRDDYELGYDQGFDDGLARAIAIAKEALAKGAS